MDMRSSGNDTLSIPALGAAGFGDFDAADRRGALLRVCLTSLFPNELYVPRSEWPAAMRELAERIDAEVNGEICQ